MSTKAQTVGVFVLIAVFLWLQVDAKTISIPPTYPEDAAENCIEGYVVLRYLVGDDGRAKDIKVVESHPPGIFDEASKQNLGQWYFQEKKDGVREITMDFTLEDCSELAHNKGFNRTPVSSAAAKPGKLSGGAG